MIVGLQGLRFVAAAFVVLAHSLGEYDGYTAIGTFGVDVFFVLSGFIISHITERDTRHFFAKRLIRIVPLYWLFTAAIAVVALVMPEVLRSASWNVAHIAASLFFFPYWAEGTGFSPILKLGWSLNYEMIFYLIFFVGMQVSHAYREFIAAVVIILIPIAISMVPTDPTSPLRFYGETIWYEFIFGMALAKFWRRYEYSLPLIPSLTIAGLSTAWLVYTSYHEVFAVPRYLLWGLPALLLVYSILAIETHMAALGRGTGRVLLWLGLMSYPIYLVHPYGIAVLHRLLFPQISFWMLLPLALIVSLVASHLATAYFDEPVRRKLRRIV